MLNQSPVDQTFMNRRSGGIIVTSATEDSSQELREA